MSKQYDYIDRLVDHVEVIDISSQHVDKIAYFRHISDLIHHLRFSFANVPLMRAIEIRSDANYSGARVLLLGMIENARCQMQIDIGYGDAVTREPEYAEYPVMFEEFEAPSVSSLHSDSCKIRSIDSAWNCQQSNERLFRPMDTFTLLRF